MSASNDDFARMQRMLNMNAQLQGQSSSQLAQYQAMQNGLAGAFTGLAGLVGMGGYGGGAYSNQRFYEQQEAIRNCFLGYPASGVGAEIGEAKEESKDRQDSAKKVSDYKLGDLWSKRKALGGGTPTWLWFYTSIAFICAGVWIVLT